MIGPGLDIEVIQGIILETDIIGTKAEVEIEDRGLGLFQETRKIDPGQVPVLVLIEIGKDAIGAMNMIILLENVLTLCVMKDLIKKMI